MKVSILFFWFFLMANSAYGLHSLNITHSDIGSLKNRIEKFLIDNNIESTSSLTRGYDIYYDTPELLLLKSERYLRYTATEYLTKKKQKQKFHEKIKLGLSNKTINLYSVKHYNNIKNYEEKHPLLVLVKRKERNNFLSVLKSHGIKYPMRLKEIFQISRIEHDFNLNYNGNIIGTIKIKESLSLSHNNKLNFSSCEIEFNNEQFSKLASEKQRNIHTFIKQINNNLETNPDNNEYTLIFSLMEKNVTLFKFLLKYPYLLNLFYSITLGIISLLILKLLFWKRISLR